MNISFRIYEYVDIPNRLIKYLFYVAYFNLKTLTEFLPFKMSLVQLHRYTFMHLNSILPLSCLSPSQKSNK